MRPITLLLLVAGFVPGIAFAQNITTLQPLIVTAEQGDPQADARRSLLRAADLDLYQAETLPEFSGLAPNLNFTSTDTRGYGDILTLRGQGNTLFFGPPSVALYVDDVPFADSFTYHSRLFEIDDMQILRGPHGASFGRNAPAGLIEINTPGPGEEQRFGFAAEYGSFDSMGARFSSRGPLGANVGHSLQLYFAERDGYVDNDFLGGEIDDRSVVGGLATLFWNPQPDVELKLRLMAEMADDGGQRLTPLSVNPSFGGDIYTVNSDLGGATDIERYQLSFHAGRDFAWGSAGAGRC